MPKLRHLALHTANVEATADFYKQVFDMKEVGRNKGNYADAIYLTDGTLNLTVLTFNSPDIAEKIGGSKSFGVVHFGFWVDDLRSEEHTSELQSLRHLVCRLLLEKK